MHFKKLQKCISCTLDLTVATRIIGFIGIMISILLVTVLLNDKYFDKEAHYDMSRNVALAFGLDWEHFHPRTSSAHHKDPEGKTISMIVIFYAVAFLLINLLLCFATIKADWRFAVPWLTCEFLGCLSKLVGLIKHFSDGNNLNNIFIIGSIVYIVTVVWWWVVVLLALLSWRYKEETGSKLELSKISSGSQESQDSNVPGKIRYFQEIINNTGNMDSPRPYSPNRMYALI